MKRRLLIMRHSKADRDSARWEDFERPLNERGEQDAPVMGQWLASQDIRPDKVIASPAVRTKQTARLVVKELEFAGEIQTPAALYEGSAREYLTQIRLCSSSNKTVLIVGHNPSLESLVELLTGEFVSLPTSAVANLAVAAKSWDELAPESNELLDVWTPKSIAGDD